jgi:hypothetical protein
MAATVRALALAALPALLATAVAHVGLHAGIEQTGINNKTFVIPDPERTSSTVLPPNELVIDWSHIPVAETVAEARLWKSARVRTIFSFVSPTQQCDGVTRLPCRAARRSKPARMGEERRTSRSALVRRSFFTDVLVVCQFQGFEKRSKP